MLGWAGKSGGGFWPVFLNCLLPTLTAIFCVILAWRSAENILTNTIFGIPTVWLAIPLLAMCIGAVFQSHFNASVDDRAVWPCIIVSGFALILFFAHLHRAEGVVCTAPLCPKSEALAPDDPHFQLALGQKAAIPVEDAEVVACKVNCVYLDRAFGSSLYFSMVTFTTLGYGDFQPVPRMRLIASFEALIGYAFLGLLVGLLIDLGASRRRPPRAV